MLKSSVIAIAICLSAACVAQPQAMEAKAAAEVVKRKVPIVISAPVTQVSSCAEAVALVDWLRFVGRLETLSTLELAGERDRIAIEHREQPSDGSRLALGYLLSRPQLLIRDIDRSRMLLAEIDTSSVYASVRDLLVRESAMIDKVAALEAHITRLQLQLDALKVIETDLTENQKELEEVPQ